VAEAKAVVKEPVKMWIKIPSQSLLGDKFPSIRLNWDEYFPGEKYEVSPEVYEELQRIIDGRQRYDVRIMRPTADPTTLRQLVGGGVLQAEGVRQFQDEHGK